MLQPMILGEKKWKRGKIIEILGERKYLIQNSNGG